MYLCRRYTEASFPVIGDRFGGRDHSTVIHAAQVIERRLHQDATFRATVERLEKMIDRSS
jgi:chromosomal replication initiator protein